MRAWLALLLVPALLAGCTTDSSDDLPDDGTGNDPSDDLTDDVTDGDGGRIDPGTGGDEAWDRDTNETFPGLVLEGTLTQYDANGSARATVSVRNDGDEDYKMHNAAACMDSWEDSMKRGNEAVQRQEPQVQCEAFSLVPFEDSSMILEWNRTLFVEDADGSGRGHYEVAPDGEYTWTITFEVYRGGQEMVEFDDSTRLAIQFTVLV